jgi:hypothetical protein
MPTTRILKIFMFFSKPSTYHSYREIKNNNHLNHPKGTVKKSMKTDGSLSSQQGNGK